MFVLSNGKMFAGSYNSEACRFSGLSSMFRILGIDSFNGVSKFLFTYDGTEFVSQEHLLLLVKRIIILRIHNILKL